MEVDSGGETRGGEGVECGMRESQSLSLKDEAISEAATH